MAHRKKSGGENITLAEFYKELEKYTPPISRRTVLTDEQIAVIRAARAKGMSFVTIVKYFRRLGWVGIGKTVLMRICEEYNIKKGMAK